MTRIDRKRYRRDWEAQGERADDPLYISRPALFSSAVAGQEQIGFAAMHRWAQIWVPWQFDGDWWSASRAFHDSAYLGDWSAIQKVSVRGPDALAFLRHVGVTDVATLEIGRLRHFVQVSEAGKVAAEGIVCRLADDDYLYTGGGGEWLRYRFSLGTWQAAVRIVTPDFFIFAVQGPSSIRVLERAVGRSLRDLPFSASSEAVIGGVPLRVQRTGITGELGYEVVGSTEFGSAVWSALVDAGEEFALCPIGLRSQLISHIEAGIATVGFDYLPATMGTPAGGATLVTGRGQRIRGTYRVDDPSELFRSPSELGWAPSAKALESHDFVGREALLAEAEAGPARRLVGLVWNTDDVIACYATLFGEEPPVAYMDMPRVVAAEYHAVYANRLLAGCSSSRIYSPYLRRMISLAILDRGVQPGDHVTVEWGNAEEAQHPVRAEVAELPFKPDRRRIDVDPL